MFQFNSLISFSTQKINFDGPTGATATSPRHCAATSGEWREGKVPILLSSDASYTLTRKSIKEYLRQRLVETGWRDQMKAHCKSVLAQGKDQNISVDQLVAAVTPYAKCNDVSTRDNHLRLT
eukprot:Partr_v1_DN27408_c2_g1_i1_m72355